MTIDFDNLQLPARIADDCVIDYVTAAKIAGISTATLRRLIQLGRGPRALHLSERRRGIRLRDLRHWLEERATGAAASLPKRMGRPTRTGPHPMVPRNRRHDRPTVPPPRAVAPPARPARRGRARPSTRSAPNEPSKMADRPRASFKPPPSRPITSRRPTSSRTSCGDNGFWL